MKTRWLMIVAVGLLVAADAPEDAVKKEKQKLQGTWVPVATDRDGQWRKAGKKEKNESRLVIKGDKFELGVGERRVIGTFVLDPGSKPKAIDLTVVAAQGIKVPEEDRPKLLGIYAVDGTRLRLCLDKKRPKEFKSGTGRDAIEYEKP